MVQREAIWRGYRIGHLRGRAFRGLLRELRRNEPNAEWVVTRGLTKSAYIVNATDVGHLFLCENLRILARQ
jgi:hypothetical protein